MKAILEFNLPEDDSAYIAASHGMDAFMVLIALDQAMRNHLKYGGPPHTWEEVRQMLHDELADRNCSLDMIQ